MAKYDLHIHTNASDGLFSPAEVINMAEEAKLAGISITDHDTVAGLYQAEVYLKEYKTGVEFIPGIELNTEYKEEEVHILGYFIDYRQEKLIRRLTEIKAQREERAKQMVEKLQKLGWNVCFQQVKKFAQGDLVGRPHIAMALVEKGYMESIEEAFARLLAQGKPAYVPRYKFTPREAVDLVKGAGGIAVLAHPGLIRDRDVVTEVIKMGIDGMEVFYPQHDEEDIEYFQQLCRSYNLLMTGGSDFHGTSKLKIRNVLGISGLDEHNFEKLELFMSRKKTL